MMTVIKSTNLNDAKDVTKRTKVNGLMNITNWKQEMVNRIIHDDELMKLMVYPYPDWKSRPDVPMEERLKLIDTQIFKYRFVDPIVEKKKSYITLGMANFVALEEFRLFSNEFIQGYIYIHVFTDREIMDTHQGVRQDLIAERIYHLFQASQGIGIGILEMQTFLEIWFHNNAFGGYSIGFHVSEMK